MRDMKVGMFTSQDALGLIESEEFRLGWKNLYSKCPWSSVFQSDDFVITWYRAYQERYRPLIITGNDARGNLTGLLTLAIDKVDHELVVAGTSEAEYHAWLALPEDGNDFILSALETLRETFPKAALTFLFVLPGVPLDWIDSGSGWDRRVYINKLRRGLLEIGDGSGIRNTIRKKRQNKINRLKRLGNLHLDRIEDPAEFEEVFEEIRHFQALRLRAVQNLNEVDSDPCKKGFYLNLMRIPGMIHATALRIDDRLVSAQIHNYNRDQVRLGIITHSPFFAKYSPGELHILMVCSELADEGVPVFDLTPGGNYKDRFATHFDEVLAIKVFFDPFQAVRYRFKRRLIELGKNATQSLKFSPDRIKAALSLVRDWLAKWRGMSPAKLLVGISDRLRDSLRKAKEVDVYTFRLDQLNGLPDKQPMKRDHLPDLLAYRPGEFWQPPTNRFLKKTLEYLEAGHHVYTLVEDGRMTQYGWLIEPGESRSLPDTAGIEAEGIESVLPPDSVLISDYYMQSQGRALPEDSLCQILRDAARIKGARNACICLSKADHSMRQMIEHLGFVHHSTV